MPRFRINWKLIIVLFIGCIVVAVTGYGLRQWQRSRRAETGLVMGNKAYQEQDWEAAARHLGRYLVVSSTDVDALLKYAKAQLNIRPFLRGNMEQAINAYRTVLRLQDSNVEAAEALVGIYLQVQLPGEAELIASRAAAKNPTSTLRRMLAIAMIQQRKFKEASDVLRSLVQEQPDYVLAYDELGKLAEKWPEMMTETAQFWYDKAVENNPSSAAAWLVRGSWRFRHSDKNAAMADFTEAEKKDLSDSTIRLHLAQALIEAAAIDSAVKHLEAVYRVEPANTLLWQVWANLALKSNTPQTMKKVARDGLKALAGQAWDFMPTAAELYVRSGDIELAQDCIKQMRKKEIAPPMTEYLEGLIANQQGRYYEAVKHLYMALQNGNDSPVIRLELANVLSRLGDRQSAIQQLRILISQNPDLSAARLALARLLSENGNWDEASQQAHTVAQTLPDESAVAMIYLQSRIQMLAQNQTEKDSPLWQEVEDGLAKLENVSDNKLSIHLLQFQVAVLRSRFDAARQLLENLRSSYPSRVETAMAEVELLVAQDQSEQALKTLSRKLDEFPQSVSMVNYFASLLAEKGQQQKCEEILKDAMVRLTAPADRRQAGLLLAGYYNQWDQQDKRYQILDAMIKEMPDDIVLYSELLRCANVAGNIDAAQPMIDKIKSLEGENGYRWRYEQAKIWFIQKDNKRFSNLYPQIITLLKNNILANPEDQASRLLLAMAYERAGELQLAISTYTEALDRSPRDMQIIVSTVAALYKVNEYDRADRILSQAGREKLFHPELERLQLQSYIKRGQLSSAGDMMENLLRSDPGNESICLSLALLKTRQNKFEDAGVLIRKLKAQKPDSVVIAAAEVEWYVRQDKSAEALLLCDSLVDKQRTVAAYLLRARTLAVLGQSGRALQDLDAAAVAYPDSAEVLVMRSDMYNSTGRMEKALEDIQKALSLEADNIQVQKRAISLFLTSGDKMKLQQGKEILTKAMELNPNSIELKLSKARYLLAENTTPAITQARDILLKITEERPKTSQAWVLLAQIAFHLKQTTQAADIILRGLVYQPNDESLLLLKAQLEAKSSPLLAIPTLKALMERNPNDTDTVTRLADAYLAAKDPVKAAALLESRLASQVSAADQRKLKTILAVALYKKGDKTRAQEMFDALQQEIPDNPAPMLSQIRLLQEDGLWDSMTARLLNWYQSRPGDSGYILTILKDIGRIPDNEAQKATLTVLQAICKKDPTHIEAATMLATLLQVKGRSTEAVELYRKILDVQPDKLEAMNNLAWILCEDLHQYEEALKMAQKGIEKAPADYADLIDTRGVIYYRLGQYDKALQDFAKCLELYPEGTPSIVLSKFHLAKALLGLGRKEDSARAISQAIQWNEQFGGLSPADVDEAKRLLKELTGEV